MCQQIANSPIRIAAGAAVQLVVVGMLLKHSVVLTVLDLPVAPRGDNMCGHLWESQLQGDMKHYKECSQGQANASLHYL